MKTYQDLYNKCINEISRHVALKKVDTVSDDTMSANWHQGQIDAYRNIAQDLAIYFKCKDEKAGE